MSAFLVNDRHIDAILTFARIHQCDPYCHELKRSLKLMNAEDVAIAGTILLAENRRSLTVRYGDPAEPFVYEFKQHSRILTPVQCLKALACLAYQLAEPDDWETTDAMRLIRQLESCACRALPRWNEEAWEITGAK